MTEEKIKYLDILPEQLRGYITKSFIYKGKKCFVAKHNNFLMSWYCGYSECNDKELDQDFLEMNIEVHGGITFVDKKVIGFDCNHAFDYTSDYLDKSIKGSHKWTESEVVKETKNMVDSYFEVTKNE